MHQEFFERNGRHHIWVIDIISNNRVIYDNHDIIHIYGDDKNALITCEMNGLHAGEINIPFPHSHHYNNQYDREEDIIFEDYEWTEFPLVPEHDDP